MNNFYLKMSPLTGMVGYGGGPSGLMQKSGSIPKWYGERGIPKGYYYAGKTHHEIEYITIQTPGSGTDFGDLHADVRNMSGFGGQGMGVFVCGQIDTTGSNNWSATNQAQYITFATIGSAGDFCDMIGQADDRYSCSDGNRGICSGGGQDKISIEYTEISTKSNGADFGDLNENRAGHCSTNDDTYAVNWGSSENNGRTNLDYITIQTTGNATNFGNTMEWSNNDGNQGGAVRYLMQGLSSDQGRGIAGGGHKQTGNNVQFSTQIEYIVHTTTGNGQDFGDLTVGGNTLTKGNVANSTRGVFCTGSDNRTKLMDYITFDTAGNATTFGSLSSNDGTEQNAGCSGD